ncbi:MAG: mucoidy inhibitor MuiA family protein [Planctomycetes bacterium]|nr:mucoidy inhibitor MuiA family protein [Planctomycetota bacterium]
MRSRLFTILVAGFFLTPNLEAQVSLEMLPTEANAIITEVTLYRNRAAITRTATLDLEAGGHSVFFRNLPNVAFLDSIQARVSDNASLLSVDTSNKPTLTDNSTLVAKLVTEIEEVELKIATSNAQTDAIALQIQMLETLIEKATNDKAPPVDIEAFDTQITFIGTRMQELSTDKSANATENQELRTLLQNLKQKKQNISSASKNQIDTVVDVGVVKACTVEIQLTYLVRNATWLPTYSIHANAQGNLITIGYDAELAQKTGENWTDVALTLSTAQPQQSISPPMPRPWFVDVFEPAPPAQPSVGVRMSTAVEDTSAEFQRRGGDLSFAWAKNVESASANATVTGDGPAVSFVLPRTVTVPSNAVDKQKTSLGVIETSAKQYLIAVPMLTDNVFTRSEVTNKSDYILLPGRASIFHGSDYVGKTSLPTISPNESFSLDLGIDPSVNVTRTLVEKVTSSTGLFSSGKQTIYAYQIALSNGTDMPIDIRVFDRVPVSRNEEIEVLVKNLSAPLSTDVTYENTDRQQGILRWDITVPANRTGDQSYMLTWQVEIARGKEIELTPLPE